MNRNFIKSGVLALMIGLSGVALGNSEITRKDDNIKEVKSQRLEVNVYPRENGLIAVNFKKELNETV